MFAPVGWISLNDIVSQLKWIIAEDLYYGLIDYDGEDIFELVWLFTLETDEIAVCLPSGEALPASRMLLHTSDPSLSANDHIDLIVGTIGSAHAAKQSTKPLSEFELKNRYGPFLHLPVIFLEASFTEFCEQLQGTSRSSNDPDTVSVSSVQNLSPAPNLSPKAVSEGIIQLFDNGELSKFDDAKDQLGKEMSVRQFRFAWNMARLHRPDISKPGRKPARTIS
ncbi:hypothetical protein [Sulfitobacter sp. R86518]|uniref:hypothetical protein n=1 Tax=Sulfitobacter sp. R86518 TaxID=3093858 RepID=UPI0036DBB628